jgi:hypothetical protein
MPGIGLIESLQNQPHEAPCLHATAKPRGECSCWVGRALEFIEAHRSSGDPVYSDPRCPTCGFTMCEQADERPITTLAMLATPNGNYRCYHCSGIGR